MRRGILVRTRTLTLVALVFAIATLLGRPPIGWARTGNPAPTTPTVPGEIIVGFEEGVSEAERDRILASVGVTEEEDLEDIDAELGEVDPEEVDEAIKELEEHAGVEYAEPNFLLFADDHPVGSDSPNDPAFHELWGLHNFGQTVNGITGTPDADVDALEAWGVTKGSGNVVVGVIDSGVDFGHPDLGGSMETSPLMWINAGENCGGCRTDGFDNDLNGYIDDWRGWDFVNNDNNPFDDYGHGTHVTGTIGAVGNDGKGVVGVNWTVKIMALKFLNASGSGMTANAVKAVLYASAMGAQATNNSWGGGGFSQALLDAIREADTKGSLFVAAAGNSSVNNDTTAHYPSSYDVPNVISVAATDSSDAKASFSNYGKRTVDLGAPGVSVFSTWPVALSTSGSNPQPVCVNGVCHYKYASGTSMATPHVAGASALLKAAFPGASHLGLKALLFRTVDPNASLSGRTTTEGRLNVNGAARCSGAPKVWIDAPAADFTTGVGDPLPIRALGASCAVPGGATVTASGNGAPIALTARGDGLWEGSYTPTSEGPVTISASATVGGSTDTRTVSGTAVQNYRFEDAPFAWIDAAAGGTKAGVTGDDSSVTVSLPFSFTFYGQAFTSVKISSNGFLVLGSSAATAWANVPIPRSTAPNGFVAPFWDDLSPQLGGGVWYKATGTAPNRSFVVLWLNTPEFDGVGDSTFEVILQEGTNDIFFQYKDVNFADSRYNYGASATVGVENLAGTVGKQFSYNQAVLQPYENAKAIRFTTQPSSPPTPPAAPTGLTATAASSTQIDLSWSAAAGATGYKVQRSPDGTTGWTQIATTSATTHSDTGLTPSTLYYYRVIATNAGGDSPASSVASATTNTSPPPAPTGLTATAASSTQIDLSWSAAAGATGYKVQRSPDGTTGWTQIAATSATTHSDTGLTPSTLYYYRVIATNAGGDSPASSVASATTQAGLVQTKSYAPTSVTIRRGIYLAGVVGNLASDNGTYYEVNSVFRGSKTKQVVDWYGEATIDVTGVTKLTLTYDGSYTTTVTQTLYVRNFSTGVWQLISSATVLPPTDLLSTWSTTNPAPYISSSGQVRLRVHASNGSSFTSRGDLMQFTVEY